ncbi:hypothetical protein [Pseudobacteriovorax antillogorgiicola]|uniref:Uncharacterized protein n=1 Tax=Pseudobacteriovorax antillogorgiicola TaxID=1513793 RepID=A0A1Y6CUL2_9BACT|nr:hypothetical protein [Pseudobacteriovorax antillogorgiicola]TCS44229.1 hypothetical protein EDD56_13429 [Pseudobacteriovorax antillogorgiicola]SMF80622.1 hypothetical protein SAMN06296036_13530 [Pseudobacteriovorax antillogorgiicola]
MTSLEKSSFIEPSPKPELDGKLGLYASEIAASLGISNSDLRRKLTKRGLLDELELNNLTALTFVRANDINGLPFQEYVFTVDAARFIVARWNNALGSAYLSFLVRTHSQVEALEEQARHDPVSAQLAAMLQMRKHQLEQDEKIKQIQLNTSDEAIDVKVRAALSKEDEFPSDCMTISEIAATHFPGISKEIVRGVLSGAHHPKGHFQHKNEKGETNMSRPYKKAGLEFVAKRFFDEAKIVEETPKTIIRVHPRVGGRIFQSKAKMRAG